MKRYIALMAALLAISAHATAPKREAAPGIRRNSFVMRAEIAALEAQIAAKAKAKVERKAKAEARPHTRTLSKKFQHRLDQPPVAPRSRSPFAKAGAQAMATPFAPAKAPICPSINVKATARTETHPQAPIMPSHTYAPVSPLNLAGIHMASQPHSRAIQPADKIHKLSLATAKAPLEENIPEFDLSGSIKMSKEEKERRDRNINQVKQDSIATLRRIPADNPYAKTMISGVAQSLARIQVQYDIDAGIVQKQIHMLGLKDHKELYSHYVKDCRTYFSWLYKSEHEESPHPYYAIGEGTAIAAYII